MQTYRKLEQVTTVGNKVRAPESRRCRSRVLDFGKLAIKTASLTVKCEGERHSIAIGQVGTLRIIAMKGASGKVPVIENAPFPGALPRLHCAKAEVHTYDDGESKWDFAGRNGFYGAFEMKSK
jgi:hypothetical protein